MDHFIPVYILLFLGVSCLIFLVHESYQSRLSLKQLRKETEKQNRILAQTLQVLLTEGRPGLSKQSADIFEVIEGEDLSFGERLELAKLRARGECEQRIGRLN